MVLSCAILVLQKPIWDITDSGTYSVSINRLPDAMHGVYGSFSHTHSIDAEAMITSHSRFHLDTPDLQRLSSLLISSLTAVYSTLSHASCSSRGPLGYLL